METVPEYKKTEHRNWINSQQDRMTSLVEKWASINSGTYHRIGVESMVNTLLPEFSKFEAVPQILEIPSIQQVNDRGELQSIELGPALSVRCRPDATKRVLLAIHTDTVYSVDSVFQAVKHDSNRLCGPGVADAKGGIAILLVALEALERFLPQELQEHFGWEVLLNPDEEIGSPGSASLLQAAASRNHVGLLFEPSLPDGSLVSQRKGSANFEIVCRGKSAHAGRHFEDGRNAIAAAASIAVQIHSLNGRWPGTTFNVARVDGGGPLNMVPDVGVVGVNVRYSGQDQEATILHTLDGILSEVSSSTGVESERFGEFTAPPKQAEGLTETLLHQVVETGTELGLNLNLRPTGGVCDGNRLQRWGLPNVDTLGVRGGEIHSHDEFMIKESLAERATLTAELLLGWATNKIPWPISRTEADYGSSEKS
ncbi:hydrolase [Thalassoglobus polymorphus]|nr:hydrolase [Thalassoglobus polymorphus]